MEKNVTGEYIDMGRRAKTRMKILDIRVEQGQCIIGVEIRRKSNVWKKAYGFKADYLKSFDFENFKERVLGDSRKLVEDKDFEDRVLMRIEDLKNKDIFLD